MTRQRVVLGLLLVGMVASACSGGRHSTHSRNHTHTIRGTVDVSCAGSRFLLPKAGDTVTVRNEKETVIAVGTLEGPCGDVHFTIAGVPDAKFYEIDLGALPGLGPKFSFAQMQHNGWKVTDLSY
jgi:hypothetical protein